ncbi:phage tail length tape measure family protein [Neisseria musculi]|uniref:Prophage tail length tape measure family protein n=1 Tax=Neisseria musculi TaxID=1815583 RepID=A0A7H1M8E6_9NEIS|nr:phage tail length tape measure family protein [Neisseria musculi]QNT57911.1 prophage tail length tape measure family protein [Neisseria musculi]
MASSNEVSLKFSADTEAAKRGIESLEKTVEDFGRKAEAGGKRAAAGAAKIGDGAKQGAEQTAKSAREIERETRRVERALERLAVETRTGGRNTLEYYLEIAKQRGADIPYLESRARALNLVGQATARATLSQRQYNNAMRMVPAQMTDIVTQLAGGQNPLLIALQQGGQLRDSFGGFGSMFKGLASLFTPARVAIGGAASAVAALGYAAYKGAEDVRALENALTLAGGSAGISADRMQSLVLKIGAATGGYAEAREALIALVASGRVGAQDYERFAQSIVLQSQATGKSVEDVAKQYEQIAEDPLKAIVKFSGVYQTLNADVYAQVKALQAQGRAQEAVELVLRKFADESDQMSGRVLENLGLIEKAWKGIKDAAAGAWESMKSIGRSATLDEQIADLELQLKQGHIQYGRSGLYGSIYSGLSADARAEKQRQLEELKLKRKINDEQEKERQRQAQTNREAVAAQERIERVKEQNKTADQRRLEAERQLMQDIAKLRADGRAEQVKAAEKELAVMRQRHAEERKAEAERAVRAAKRNQQAVKYTVNQKVLSQAAQYGYADIEKRYGLPKNILAALSMQESRGNIGAVSNVGARGVMQFMPDTARRFGVDVGSVKSSAEGAAKYLRFLLDRYHGNIAHALSAYHSGEGNIDNMLKGRWKLGPVGRKYAPEVMARMDWLNGGKGEVSNDIRKDFIKLGEPEKTAYQKWSETFLQSQEKINASLALSALNAGKTIDKQLELLSSPLYAQMSAAEQAAALAAAEHADEQAALNSVLKKYADIQSGLQQEAAQQLEDKLFEISLIGKTREEIEKLTLARVWDKHIAEAAIAGAPPEMLESMRMGKADSLDKLRQRQLAQDVVDNDWRSGLESGLQAYMDSFGSMREQMEDATVQTFDRMGDALADFVATGKLDFRDLTVSILQDLAKMLVKMAIVNAMKSALAGYAEGGVVMSSYSGGGYTGHGGKYEPAGIVHKGEVVFSQRDVARHGGVMAVERLRLKGYADGGVVGVPTASLGALNRNAGGNTNISITINSGGGSEASVQADTEMGRQLAQALPVMIEQWYVKNVARPGGTYHKG